MFKNVASQKITVLAWDSATGLKKSGDAGNITVYVSKDDGSVTALSDSSATELDATNAKGLYSFDLAQAETNADKLVFSGKSSTSGIEIVPATIYTYPATGLLAPTTAGRTLDVSATGEAGIDWANVGSPTTSLALTGTTIATTGAAINPFPTGTTTSIGTVSSLVCSSFTAVSDPSFYRGQIILLTSGTYSGTQVTATTYASGSGTLQFTPALPGVVASGVTFVRIPTRSRNLTHG